MQYQGITGRLYSAEDYRIARGGEGNIYPIKDQDALVVKIFKPEKRTIEREEKLKAMVKTKLSDSALEQVVWPLDVVYEQGVFAGYVMPKLNNTDSLTTIYSSGTVGKYDLRHRLLTAINLCYAIQTIHDMGQVCGDLNPQNICVNLDEKDRSKNFHVTLVDADSYHYIAEGKNYRCEVGLSEYLAPEVQEKLSGGLSLRDIPLPTYTKETDLFALAVHIFTLLMNGCHPFACAKEVRNLQENDQNRQADASFISTIRQMNPYFLKNSVVAPQPNENMKDGFFPFYQRKSGITIPIYAPTFDSLPHHLQRLFIRTFVDGYKDPQKRVDSGEWIVALKRTIEEKLLVRCQDNTQHYYFAGQTGCSLCNVEQRIREMNKKWNMDSPSLPSVSDEQAQTLASGNTSGNTLGSASGNTVSVVQKKKRSGNNMSLAQKIAWIVIVGIISVSLILVADDAGWFASSEEGAVDASVTVYTADGTNLSKVVEDADLYQLLLRQDAYSLDMYDYDYRMPLDNRHTEYIQPGSYYVTLCYLGEDDEILFRRDIGELEIPEDFVGKYYNATLMLSQGVEAILP